LTVYHWFIFVKYYPLCEIYVTYATFRQLGLLPPSDDDTVISTSYFNPIDSVTTT